jgi:hypothetical protein
LYEFLISLMRNACPTHIILLDLIIIALGYRLDDRDSRVRFPAWAGKFSLHHPVQNGSGTHPASYPMGTRGSSGRGVKLTTHLHLVPRSRVSGTILPLPQYVFMAWFLVKHRDNFTTL